MPREPLADTLYDLIREVKREAAWLLEQGSTDMVESARFSALGLAKAVAAKQLPTSEPTLVRKLRSAARQLKKELEEAYGDIEDEEDDDAPTPARAPAKPTRAKE